METVVTQETDELTQNSCPTPEELTQINGYTRREFKAEELYVFSVVLCDNEIDRDLERFSIPALKKMAELFLGKTGIYNHSMDTSTQNARIFHCETEQFPDRVTSCGEPYTRLVARAYLPRGEKNKGLILDLESGMKKEVSVGCSVGKAICSICGADRRTEGCGHVPGEIYGGVRCCTVLEEPTDAYEWSFVAVPAQREAGVIKHYEECSDLRMNCTQDVKKATREMQANRFQKEKEPTDLMKKLKSLEEAAAWGNDWKQELCMRVKKMGSLALPELENEVLEHLVEVSGIKELKALEKAFSARAEKEFPLFPQLAGPDNGEKRQRDQNETYQI